MIPAIPFRELDALFLDAGNTLLHWDCEFLSELLASFEVACSPAALERAEAACRPGLSRRLAAGTSTEGADVFAEHVRNILEASGAAGWAERAHGERDALLRGVLRRLRAAEADDRLWSRVPPGTAESLAQLRAGGLRLAVVSNSNGTVEAKLERAGLRAHFHAVIDSHLVGVEKPEPAIFRRALELAGSAAERTLHVGDIYSVDVKGARDAGLHAVLLDPFGDWERVDCPIVEDVPALARRILEARR